MRIDTQPTPGKASKGSRISPGCPSDGLSLFAETLLHSDRALEGSQLRLELEGLKDRIDQAGVDLERRPTIEHLEAFRNLIITFTRKITANAYRLENLGSWNSVNCQHILCTIDQEADTLLGLVMAQNRDRLRITAKIMEIRGLIVDVLS